MISGQVDRLRTAAQTYRRLGNHSAESMLLDAADTIWQLRDDLQRANAENAKLRELVRGLLTGYECGRGELCEGCTWTGMEDPHEFRCPARVKARELGVEVDG